MCRSHTLLIDWGLLLNLDGISGGRRSGAAPTGPRLCNTVRSAAVLAWDALSVVMII